MGTRVQSPGCPRNCKRYALRRLPLDHEIHILRSGKVMQGAKPQARRPAYRRRPSIDRGESGERA
jgi:hypothetical protein